MLSQNVAMNAAVQESQKKIEKIMLIKSGPENQNLIGKRLHEIVDQCLEIDVSEVNKRLHVENEA
jgi:hypothetical protein